MQGLTNSNYRAWSYKKKKDKKVKAYRKSAQKKLIVKRCLLIIDFNKNFMAPFYGWGSTASRLEPLQGGSLLFTTQFPEIPGISFYRPRKDERLSQPWSHPVVLNTGPLDWESSTLKVHKSRFQNLPICSNSYKNNTLKILHC